MNPMRNSPISTQPIGELFTHERYRVGARSGPTSSNVKAVRREYQLLAAQAAAISSMADVGNQGLRDRMHSLYVPVTDGGTKSKYLNLHPWWRDPAVLAGVGELLAEPFVGAGVTLVVGPPSSGYLLGALVARHLGVGFGTIRKDPSPSVDSDAWLSATTPPDYRDRHLVMGARKGVIGSTDRVLAIDDIVDTGSQLKAIQKIVTVVGATWVGASVAIDLSSDSSVRRQLGLKAIFNGRELP